MIKSTLLSKEVYESNVRINPLILTLTELCMKQNLFQLCSKLKKSFETSTTARKWQLAAFWRKEKKKSPTTGHMLNTFSVFWVVSPYHQYVYSYTVFHIFPMILTRRIWLPLKSLINWRSVTLFSRPCCLLQPRCNIKFSCLIYKDMYDYQLGG